MTMLARIYEKDSSLWSADESVQRTIDNRLGWLDVANRFQGKIAEISAIAEQIRGDGFESVILLGLGGSGLAPDVFSKLFPRNQNSLHLEVLDSTCAEQILDVEQRVDGKKTLFIVSSKSGGTIETLSLFRYFHSCVEAENDEARGQHFVAITDGGSGLQQLAEQFHFRHCFVNPSDIGGRFSALSYFGLVPAALLGISLETLLTKAAQAHLQCQQDSGIGVRLGQWLMNGYESQELDKLALYAPKALFPLIEWVEQLVAESLGKQGQGIVPILNEGDSGTVFVHSKQLSIGFGEENGANFSDVRQAHWYLVDEYDVAAHFFHWEIAVALAGIKLGINPFDEPNVTESKVRTTALLERYSGEDLPVPEKVLLQEILSMAKDDSYISILAYWPFSEASDRVLNEYRQRLEKRTKLPVTLNYGPRYLHSTGQLHKGGKRQGLFIVLVQAEPSKLAIPGADYGFNELCHAQALGDFQILQEKGLPTVFLRVADLAELLSDWG